MRTTTNMTLHRPFLRLLLAIGFLLLVAACGGKEAGEHDEGTGQEQAERGPHGGKMLRDGHFALEVKIFEEGVPPEFRLYAFKDEKPLPPAAFAAEMRVVRLDRTQNIRFAPRADYLVGNEEVYEPHSFDVQIRVTHAGEQHNLAYSQYEGRTELSPEQAQAAGIVVEAAGPQRISSSLALPGQLALNADRTAHVVPRLSGVVTRVMRNLGDRVGRGETLAVLESPEIAGLRSEHLAAVQRRDLLKATADREEALFRKKISSQEEWLRAKNAYQEAAITVRSTAQRLQAYGLSPSAAARGSLSSVSLRSPIAGTVIGKDVTAGEAVGATEILYTVADLSSIWVDVDVAANLIAAVRQGQRVTVEMPGGLAAAEGVVSYVGPLVGAQNRSARARVVIPNPHGDWRPGTFVNVRLTTEEVTVAVAVRAEAIQTFRDWNVVFIQAGNEYEVRPLELGRRDDAWVEVTGGLDAGQKYVAKNSFVLKADVLKAGASHDH